MSRLGWISQMRVYGERCHRFFQAGYLFYCFRSTTSKHGKKVTKHLMYAVQLSTYVVRCHVALPCTDPSSRQRMLDIALGQDVCRPCLQPKLSRAPACTSTWTHLAASIFSLPVFAAQLQTYLTVRPNDWLRQHFTFQQQQQQPFNGRLFGTTQVGRYQKKHPPTHTHPDQRASFITFLHLQGSMASSLFNLRAWLDDDSINCQLLFVTHSKCLDKVWNSMATWTWVTKPTTHSVCLNTMERKALHHLTSLSESTLLAGYSGKTVLWFAECGIIAVLRILRAKMF